MNPRPSGYMLQPPSSMAALRYGYQGAVWATTYSKSIAVLDMKAKAWTPQNTQPQTHTLVLTQRDDIYVGHE